MDAALVELNGLAKTYSGAYATYKQVLERANEREEAADALVGFVVGVTLSAGVGLGFGIVFPLAQNASRALIAFSESRNALVAGIGGTAVQAASGGKKVPAPLAEAHPLMMKVDAYQKTGQLYRKLALLGARFGKVSTLDAAASGLRADCRELALTGQHRSLSEAIIEERVMKLDKHLVDVMSLRSSFLTLSSAIAQTKITATLAHQNTKPRDLETRIWLKWMASLSGDKAETLGSDPIEERLGRLGLMAKRGMTNAPQHAWQSSLGWGVGTWHSGDDSRKGAKKARGAVEMLSHVGKAATYQVRAGAGLVYLPSGETYSAAPARRELSKYDLDGKTVVITKASLTGVLVWVDLPKARLAQQEKVFIARSLVGETVTLKNITVYVWTGGRMRYNAKATTTRYPGRVLPATTSPFTPGQPPEGTKAEVERVYGDTLVVKPLNGKSSFHPDWP